MTRTHFLQSAARVIGLGVVAFALEACDFKVTNPGPTLDSYLADSLALSAQVAGVGYTLSDGMNYSVLHTAVAARELFPTGQSGQFGIEPGNWIGSLVTEEQGTPWNTLSRARWLADQAVNRTLKVLGPDKFAKHPTAAQGLIWRGFAYRVLGENMCVAIIDNGPSKPSTENAVRAESTFTAAIAVATAASRPILVNAAYAGRAQVRAMLGKWTEAVADAGQVTTSFVYQMPYYANVDEYGYNRTMWSSTDQSFYKATSVWGTWYATYFDASSDPRVKYNKTLLKGAGAFPPIGQVNWWPQQKYVLRTAGINLATGREMRLIEAEAALRNSDITTAMARIDALRSAIGAPVLARPANLVEAWSILKRERGIELWLEGRRLADFRRWTASNTPGTLDPLEVVSASSYLQKQDLCLPVSRQELDANPNLNK